MLLCRCSDVESDMAVKTELCQNTPSSYNTTLFTTGLCYEHRHDAIKIPNVSTTSTTATEAEIMIIYVVKDRRNGMPPFLLTQMLLANAGV